MRPLSRFVALALLLAACASGGARPGPAPFVGSSGWSSPRHRGHPLVGTVWNLRENRVATAEELAAAAAQAHFLLLGEVHDNADHHRIQAALVRETTRAGRKPALAFEMLEAEDQAALDAAQAAPGLTPEKVAAAVAWDDSGWPPFAVYRPIFEAGLEAGLPLVAANLSRDGARVIMRGGEAALPVPLRSAIASVGPLPEALAKEFRAEMAASHCGQLPERLVDPMVLAQRARDAQMALRLAEADAGQGAILVTGHGHTRNDRGVPLYLAPRLAGRSILSLAIVEVIGGVDRIAPDGTYGGEPLRFDWVVFTPASRREDPCAALREHGFPSHPPPAPPAPAPGAKPGDGGADL